MATILVYILPGPSSQYGVDEGLRRGQATPCNSVQVVRIFSVARAASAVIMIVLIARQCPEAWSTRSTDKVRLPTPHQADGAACWSPALAPGGASVSGSASASTCPWCWAVMRRSALAGP